MSVYGGSNPSGDRAAFALTRRAGLAGVSDKVTFNLQLVSDVFSRHHCANLENDGFFVDDGAEGVIAAVGMGLRFQWRLPVHYHRYVQWHATARCNFLL